MAKEYYNQLDGLRALSVFGVLVSHWIFIDFIQKLGLGFWGVNFFFVLSGFLITEILINQIENKLSYKKLLSQFYIKRALRILPAYCAFLLITAFLNPKETYLYIGYLYLTPPSFVHCQKAEN